jgi:hypothetical protein
MQEEDVLEAIGIKTCSLVTLLRKPGGDSAGCVKNVKYATWR